MLGMFTRSAPASLVSRASESLSRFTSVILMTIRDGRRSDGGADASTVAAFAARPGFADGRQASRNRPLPHLQQDRDPTRHRTGLVDRSHREMPLP